MLKQINHEGLVEGKKYLVEMEFKINDYSSAPYCFIDVIGAERWFHKDQPIYTLDDQPQKPDPELEMLVNVASRIYTDPIFDDGFDEAAKCAADLIAACKKIKEGER